MTGEPTVLKVINKINAKLKFLYRKNRSPELRRMLCNALIPAHFDCACPAWYPNLTKKREKKKKKKKKKIRQKTDSVRYSDQSYLKVKHYVKIAEKGT